ncbi:MAG: HEAT repeat domain-containing protein [bacterium]|nr:HEAT repeat domain-containing protein [bacterium]
MNGNSRKAILLAAVAVILITVLAVRFFSSGLPDVSSGTNEERISAIHTVAASGSEDTARILAGVVSSDAPPAVRREALAGMSHHPKPEYRPAIKKSLKDANPGVREIAVSALSMYKDKDATADLIEVVREEPEERVRHAALRGLVRCEDPTSIVTLLDRAENGDTNETKRIAMKGLLRKLGVRMSVDRDPKDGRGWRDLIQRWKESRRVQAAYTSANVRLVSRPQDRMGEDWHPERRRN